MLESEPLTETCFDIENLRVLAYLKKSYEQVALGGF